LRGRSFADVIVRWPFWRIVAGAFVLLLLAWGYTWLTWPR
jgi:type II secretory pathway component PulL